MEAKTKKIIKWAAIGIVGAIVLYRLALEAKIQMEIAKMKKYVRQRAAADNETDQAKIDAVLAGVSKLVRNNHSGWKW